MVSATHHKTKRIDNYITKKMSAKTEALMRAVRLHEYGDASKLILENEVPKPHSSDLQPRQILVRVHFSSVNFIDTYKRTGLYPTPLPAILGQDAR